MNSAGLPKRRRDSAVESSNEPTRDGPSLRSSLPPSSLPPSSPPTVFMDSDQDDDLLGEFVEDLDDEDDDGEALIGEGMENDYTANPLQDRYSMENIDDEEYGVIDDAARRAAENKMRRRDKAAGVTGYGRHAPDFLQDDDLSDPDQDFMKTRRRRHQYDELDDMNDMMDDDMTVEELGNVKATSIAEWIAMEQPRRAILREFKNFLMTFVNEKGDSVYGQRIKTLGELNSESLAVSYAHLSSKKAILAYFLANSPLEMLKLFDIVALEVTLIYYPDYERIHSEIHVRITDLPTLYTLRELRQSHLNCLVHVGGVVTRRTGVFPQLKYVKFNCLKCGDVLGPFYQDTNTEVKISYCQNCQSRGPFTVNSEKTVYRNYQKMTLQESPGSVPAGRLPRHREVILLWDLIDSAKPGDEVHITGVYRNNFDASLNTKNGFPVFQTILEANFVSKKEDLYAAFRLTEEDEKTIRALSKDDRIGKRIIKSIAPSIYGHDDIKTAIALSLFGGVSKDVNGKHRIRGDINVLLLGDPGTAKSQFLKYIEKTAHRAVFTTGQGASAVGLTASVRKDPITREWTLEGGALVLADKGVCLIDEFDKMNDQDRTSIHEAMEQQSISISKAGIVTTLQARCAIIAAANPTRGRYNPTIPFSQNVELTEPILSRFDVLCVVKDSVDPVMDELLARFVVGSHLRSHPDFSAKQDEVNAPVALDADIIPQDILRKYILYAKERIRPQLHQMDQDKISRLYADLRRESMSTGSYPITVRHLESMIRLSEANAKMHLREYVRSDDIDVAIRVAVNSFVSTQKMSIKRVLDRSFRKYITTAKDHEELLSFILGTTIKEKARLWQLQRHEVPEKIEVALDEFERRAITYEIYGEAVRKFLKSALFSQNGYTWVAETKTVVKIFS